MLGATRLEDVVPDLARLLGDRDLEVRRVAARALGRSGHLAAAEPLLAARTAERLSTRDTADALVLLEPAADRVLVEALRSRDHGLAAMAADVLGLRGAVAAAALLTGHLTDHTSLDVRVHAARALGRLGVPGAVPGLLAVLSPAAPVPLRAAAAKALDEMGAAAAIPGLRVAVYDRSYEVAHTAAYALATLGGSGRACLLGIRGVGLEPAASHAAEALAELDLHVTQTAPVPRALAAAGSR